MVPIQPSLCVRFNLWMTPSDLQSLAKSLTWWTLMLEKQRPHASQHGATNASTSRRQTRFRHNSSICNERDKGVVPALRQPRGIKKPRVKKTFVPLSKIEELLTVVRTLCAVFVWGGAGIGGLVVNATGTRNNLFCAKQEQSGFDKELCNRRCKLNRFRDVGSFESTSEPQFMGDKRQCPSHLLDCSWDWEVACMSYWSQCKSQFNQIWSCWKKAASSSDMKHDVFLCGFIRRHVIPLNRSLVVL